MRLAKSFAEIDSSSRQPAEARIRRFMPIGSVGGSAKVSVSAFEFFIPSQDHAFRGVRIETSSTNEYQNGGVATIALDEADMLMASLEQLANVKITTDVFEQTEVEMAIDDLKITVFNVNGRVMAAVQAGSTVTHLARNTELLDLRKLVSLAIAHLQKHPQLQAT
jgi:hypothetical protein